MNTIEAFEQDVWYQVKDLRRTLESLKVNRMKEVQQERSVFTGTGDSFAAAMIAQFASGNRIRCIDPMDISADPSTVRDRFLYCISVSGSTSANIAASRVGNRVGRKTVAITANAESELARVCDEVVELKFRSSGILTAGSIGFSASMLACVALLKKVEISNVRCLFDNAEEEAAKVQLMNNVYVIGSGITYPLAIYGVAKIYEVFGMRAQYAMLEQFCHMELFSVKKGDTFLILSEDDKAGQLCSKLTDEGFNVYTSKHNGKNLEEELLYHTMFLQLIVLKNAKKKKLRECYFVRNNKLRSISSSLIY